MREQPVPTGNKAAKRFENRRWDDGCGTVPANASSMRSSFTGRERPGSDEGKRFRILIIDEEPMLGEVLALLFSDRRYAVDVATSAVSALARIAAGARYDLVLCDAALQGITCIELREEVERSSPELAERLVFMTGGLADPVLRARIDALAWPVLVKPIDIDTLVSRLEQRIQLRTLPARATMKGRALHPFAADVRSCREKSSSFPFRRPVKPCPRCVASGAACSARR